MMYRIITYKFGSPWNRGVIVRRGCKHSLGGYVYSIHGTSQSLLFFNDEVEIYDFTKYYEAL
jgi:hypothetical protein